MENEKNFWSVGNKNRGKEVISNLRKLGGINKYNLQGIMGNEIYYINHCGYIASTIHDTEEAYLIKKYYKEVKLKDLFSEGDILINKEKTEFCVFKEYDDYSYDFFASMLYAEENKYDFYKDTEDIKYLFTSKDFRKATEAEINLFHEILHTFKKDWDGKTLNRWVWKPKNGDLYFLVNSTGCVDVSTFYDKFTDDLQRVNLGNCFRTKAEADNVANKIKDVFGSM